MNRQISHSPLHAPLQNVEVIPESASQALVRCLVWHAYVIVWVESVPRIYVQSFILHCQWRFVGTRDDHCRLSSHHHHHTKFNVVGNVPSRI